MKKPEKQKEINYHFNSEVDETKTKSEASEPEQPRMASYVELANFAAMAIIAQGILGYIDLRNTPKNLCSNGSASSVYLLIGALAYVCWLASIIFSVRILVRGIRGHGRIKVIGLTLGLIMIAATLAVAYFTIGTVLVKLGAQNFCN